jgi:hypothetical protein
VGSAATWRASGSRGPTGIGSGLMKVLRTPLIRFIPDSFLIPGFFNVMFSLTVTCYTSCYQPRHAPQDDYRLRPHLGHEPRL